MHAFVVADMPFGSYHIDEKSAVKNAVRLVKETEVPAVKLCCFINYISDICISFYKFWLKISKNAKYIMIY